MNKKQLVEALDKFPDDIEIILSQDSEGNEFSSVDDFSIEYVDEGYDGGRTEDVFSGEDLSDDSVEGEIPQNFRQVLVIWPV